MDQGHRKREPPLPPTGGGPPIVSASGRIVNPAKPSAPTLKKAREQGQANLPWLPSKKTLQNTHSQFSDLFRLWSGSRYVPPELVTAQPWMPPGYRPEPLKLAVTRLSRAIVFHSPDDKVTEPPKKENQNVEGIAKRESQQPSNPDESEQSGLSEQPPRQRGQQGRGR